MFSVIIHFETTNTFILNLIYIYSPYKDKVINNKLLFPAAVIID